MLSEMRRHSTAWRRYSSGDMNLPPTMQIVETRLGSEETARNLLPRRLHKDCRDTQGNGGPRCDGKKHDPHAVPPASVASLEDGNGGTRIPVPWCWQKCPSPPRRRGTGRFRAKMAGFQELTGRF